MTHATDTGTTPGAFPPPGTQMFDTPELHQLMLAYAKALNTRMGGNPEVAYQNVLKHLQKEAAHLEPYATPSSRWKAEGKVDPHGTYYERERAQIAKGHLTDDEMANAVYMSPGIANLTCAKERIRWLSRALDRTSEALAAATSTPAPAAQDAADVRKFVEVIADGLTYRGRNGYHFCSHCHANVDSEEPHEADCLNLRATAYLEKHSAAPKNTSAG